MYTLRHVILGGFCGRYVKAKTAKTAGDLQFAIDVALHKGEAAFVANNPNIINRFEELSGLEVRAPSPMSQEYDKFKEWATEISKWQNTIGTSKIRREGNVVFVEFEDPDGKMIEPVYGGISSFLPEVVYSKVVAAITGKVGPVSTSMLSTYMSVPVEVNIGDMSGAKKEIAKAVSLLWDTNPGIQCYGCDLCDNATNFEGDVVELISIPKRKSSLEGRIKEYLSIHGPQKVGESSEAFLKMSQSRSLKKEVKTCHLIRAAQEFGLDPCAFMKPDAKKLQEFAQTPGIPEGFRSWVLGSIRERKAFSVDMRHDF